LSFPKSALLVLACIVVAPTTAHARAYFVAKNGSDSNSGTLSSPLLRVATGIGKLRAGDTLYVRAGQYFESVTAAVSGTATARIVIRAYPGEHAILDSGYPEFQTIGNSEWELVNASIGEYRSKRTYTDDRVYGYVVPKFPYENGRVALVPYDSLAHFGATTDQYNLTGIYVGPGTLMGADGRIHIRLAKTSDLRATESRYGTVFATDLPDPRDYTIQLSGRTRTLRVTGSYLTFEGLVFNVAEKTIELGAGAHDDRFESLTVWAGDRAIEGDEVGIHHVTITRCRLYGDDPYWVFWSDMKDAPYPADKLRATSIAIGGGTHDWEISYNHVRGSGQDLLGTDTAEYNLSIHHNRFENAGDDALELEGALGKTEVYENYFLNCLVTVASGQDSPLFLGPLYVYRNIIASLKGPPVNRQAGINTWNGGGRYGFEYAFKTNGADNSTKDAHYYHNTIVLLNHGGKGVNLTPQFPEGTRVANNILVTINGPVNGTYLTGLDQVVDGNLYWKMNTVDATHLMWSYDTVTQFRSATGLEAHGIGGTAKRGTDPRFAGLPIQIVDRTKSVWAITATSEHPLPLSFFLGSASPARGAGIAIPPHAVHGALPDSRSSRDLGAIPYGAAIADYDRFPFNPNISTNPPLVDVPRADLGVALAARVFPNPAVRRARLSFTLPNSGPARVELLDVQGRLVRTLLDAPALAPGAHTLELDARGGAAPLHAGVYFYRVVTHGASASGRLVIAN
jgi:hypothetical protein